MKNFIILFVWLTSLNSYCQITDGCDEVLRLASRDITIESTRANTAKYIYENYCEGKEIRSDISIELVDSDLFESFNFGFGDKKESLKQICKTYESNYKEIVERDYSSSIVVREAISAWEKCKLLSNGGIKINPQILPSSFTIDLARVGDDISVNGVDYDEEKCECVAIIKDETGKEKTSKVNSSTHYIISNGNSWNIRCRRKPKKIDGIEYYPETDFLVPTSKGTFTMTLPKNINPPHNWITEVVNDINTLKKNLIFYNDMINKKIDSVNNRFSKIEFREVCIPVESDCDGYQFSNLKGPEGFVYAGFNNINSLPGGRCGYGNKCKIFMRILE